ncbi:hypothetical protein ABZT23_19270 [Streptomyces sp. NPDC005386]|uniref:hypothetical protein n=1 Tax=Streptomyces sp. NPDC005386 TaxID=3154562 RepID=UPI0033AE2B73
MRDWDKHTVEVERSAVPLPEAVTTLLAQLETEVEKRAKSSPLAAIRAARRLEVLAAQTAYWPACDARRDAEPGQAAAALGLDESGARALLARFGRWSPSVCGGDGPDGVGALVEPGIRGGRHPGSGPGHP